jgi:predicted phage terminase large subunit-like protein
MGVPASVMVAGDGKSKEIEIAGKKAVSTGKALELRFALSDAPWMTTAGKAKGMNPPKVKARGHRFSNGNYLVRVKSIAKESYSGPVYDIQTPSHDFVCQGVTVHNCDDLAGWLLDEHKRDVWEVISIPAIAEDDELWITSEGPWGRKKGEPLDPEWWREEMDDLLKYGKWKPQTTPSGQDPIKEYATFYYAQLAQTLGSRFFSALYQQRPTPGEGGKCKLGWFKRYKHRPGVSRTVVSIDTGQKGGAENDPTVIMVWGEFDGGHAVLDVWRERVIYPRLLPQVIDTIRKWQPDAVLIEDQNNGATLLQDLGVMELANRVPLIGIQPRDSKVVRFDRITPLIESGRVWIPETDSATSWLGAFEEEVTSFPLGKHDDQIDALSQYLNWVRKEGMAFASSGQESFSDPAMTALLGRISGPWSKGGALAGAVGNGSLVFRRR